MINSIDCDFFVSSDPVCCSKTPQSQHVSTSGRGNRESEERSEMCTTTDSSDTCAGLHSAPHRFQATVKPSAGNWKNAL